MSRASVSSPNAMSYAEKARRIAEQTGEQTGRPLGLAKKTSNLFRDRKSTDRHLLDVRDFNQVIAVNPAERWIEVEGMTTYADLVEKTLPFGVMPAVVPELKSITVGGAAAGIAIESSSFRYGLMHETVLEMDVLLADGRILTCRPDNEYSDLFFGLPNSYGTLGYALRLKIQAVPVQPYVKISHRPFSDADAYFAALSQDCKSDADFIDGTAFAPNRLFISTGQFVPEAPHVSDYTYKHIYYKSIPERPEDYLTTRAYIWRWDTDWFWCSKNLGAQNPLLRRLYGPDRLNSPTYTRIMRWNSKWHFTERLGKLTGKYSEGVIQDVDIPVQNAPEFLSFLFREIGITPVWICPIHHYRPDHRFPLYPLDAHTLYINFGFWDRVPSQKGRPAGYFNRKVEKKVSTLGGIKSLYSDSHYDAEEFWRIFDKDAYDHLKAKYDPDSRFKDLYHKCVLRE